ARARIRHEKDGRPDVAIRLGKDVAGVVRLQEGDFSFDLLLGNLAQDILGKVALKFAEGGHAIVNPVEQEQNGNAAESPATKTDQETLEQTWPNRARGGSHFHDGDLVPGIDH